MIAIFSCRDFEKSTEDVIDWLNYYNASYTRYNGVDTIETVSLIIGTSKPLDIDNINVCWFRRWMEKYYINERIGKNQLSQKNYSTVVSQIKEEIVSINTFFWQNISQKKWLTHPSELQIKKMEMLIRAKELEISIPETLITTNKVELSKFLNKHTRIITKPIANLVFLANDRLNRISLKTCEITESMVTEISDTFFPSLFQNLIEKVYEIRSFYLDGEFFSMAIFSQSDEQTKIDFRNYNDEKPNRKVPYQLPLELENKLRLFCQSLKITTGSIDLIKTVSGEYVFLEINQVGQFGMTSYPCN